MNARLLLTMDEARARWPRLYAAARWSAILTNTEAGALLRDWPRYRGTVGGSEAIQHAGGPRKVIEHAIRCRRAARICYRTNLRAAARAMGVN